MRVALLLIDTQEDFFSRPGLLPKRIDLISSIQALLAGFRQRGLPVFHAHTHIRADASNRMPHWKAGDIRQCVEGTDGVRPPEALAPLPDELVITKQYFSAFGNEKLPGLLKDSNITHLVVAGIYLHGCIRNTVIDAYERGYHVWVADDAVGSTEPVHAEITRNYLDGRAAEFLSSRHILNTLGNLNAVIDESVPHYPSACIDNVWHQGKKEEALMSRMPVDDRNVSASLNVCDAGMIDKACSSARQAAIAWSGTDASIRLDLLENWISNLESDQRLEQALCKEVGKPLSDAKEEVGRMLGHIKAARSLCKQEPVSVDKEQISVHRVPVGTLGLVTPWNNPLAIPAGKIAPAIALGNTCVWKPSESSPQCASILMDSLVQAGLRPGVVNLVHGNGKVARMLADHDSIDAVSLTGSEQAGHSLSAICASHSKPIQAELGGNNAAIIMDDWKYTDDDLMDLLLSAFSFSGQRCTAIRRLIVEESCADQFQKNLARVFSSIRIGDPCQSDTQIGPLISREQRARAQVMVDEAIDQGAQIIMQLPLPDDLQGDCWMSPVVLGDVAPDSDIAQQETFAPVLLLFVVNDIRSAVTLANAVPQGLVAALYCHDQKAREYFESNIQAGILNMRGGPANIHPDVPFVGWKSSSIGPPEHGQWDLEFYSRLQVRYDRNQG